MAVMVHPVNQDSQDLEVGVEKVAVVVVVVAVVDGGQLDRYITEKEQ